MIQQAKPDQTQPRVSVFQSLDLIDVFICKRDFPSAMRQFLVMLNQLGGQLAWASEVRDFHRGGLLDEVGEVCERAVSQWQLLLDSGINLATLPYASLIGNLDVLHALMMGTHAGNCDDYIAALNKRTGGSYQANDLLKLMLCWCPNSRLNWSPLDSHMHVPSLATANAVATLAAIAPVSREADAAVRRSIEFLNSDTPKAADLSSFGANNLFMNAWMRCSNANHQDKHQVKAFLSSVNEQVMGLPLASLAVDEPGLVDGRPVMFVPLESFFSGHAMYRCYAASLEVARSQFYTVGIGMRGCYDADTEALFDRFLVVDDLSGGAEACRQNYEQVARWVREMRPAAVYYPSIGMSRWVVSLSQRRLAPVQAMSLGHPATSGSSCIDVVVAESPRLEPSRFSERLYPVAGDALSISDPAWGQRPEPIVALPYDGVVRIAVPSVAQKWTAIFLEALREVQEKADGKVEFVFFSGVVGPLYAAANHNVQRVLADATVLPLLPYDEYLSQLRRCHLHAGTFPFGGTNSLIDSFAMGLPVLAWRGEEPHSRVDDDLVRRAGLPASLVCESRDGYVERLSELVSDPEYLLSLRRQLLADGGIRKLFRSDESVSAIGKALRELVKERCGI